MPYLNKGVQSDGTTWPLAAPVLMYTPTPGSSGFILIGRMAIGWKTIATFLHHLILAKRACGRLWSIVNLFLGIFLSLSLSSASIGTAFDNEFRRGKGKRRFLLLLYSTFTQDRAADGWPKWKNPRRRSIGGLEGILEVLMPSNNHGDENWLAVLFWGDVCR